MDEGTSVFVFIIIVLVSVFIYYLIRKYDLANRNKKEESNNNDNENEDKSHDAEVDFSAFLKFCDECISNIDEFPISNETREELELCYARYGREIKDIPFSIIIQSDIICFLFKCRIYTALLNQQRNVSIIDYFDNKLPKESIDC